MWKQRNLLFFLRRKRALIVPLLALLAPIRPHCTTPATSSSVYGNLPHSSLPCNIPPACMLPLHRGVTLLTLLPLSGDSQEGTRQGQQSTAAKSPALHPGVPPAGQEWAGIAHGSETSGPWPGETMGHGDRPWAAAFLCAMH